MTAPDEENARTTAIGLARYAEEFLHAADAVEKSVDGDHRYDFLSPMPAYFCAFHAIELTAKAYLRHQKVDAAELKQRPFRHDVRACIDAGRERGLDQVFVLNADDATALKLLAKLNDGEGLRYLRIGTKEFPLWGIVWPFAVSFFRAVAEEVGWRHNVTVTFSREAHDPPLTIDEDIDGWLASASDADLALLHGCAKPLARSDG